MTDPALTLETAPLVKTRTLRCSPDHAFDTFVERIGDWWPREVFSIYGAHEGGTVMVEPQVGGRIIETSPQGEQAVWGTVRLWEPKRRLAVTWFPGRSVDEATDFELVFEPSGDACALTLTHTGWEVPGRTEARPAYDEGWDLVLERYVTGL